MKKLGKIFLTVVCFALALTAFAPAFSGAYALDAYDFDLTTSAGSLVGFKSEYEITGTASEITVPAMTNTTLQSGDSILFNIYAPDGTIAKDGSDELKGLSANTTFAPTMVGDYKVVYYLANGDDTTNILTKYIAVSRTGYYFEFPTNTNKILPSEINSAYTTAISLPMPEVYDSKTEEKVEDAVVTVVLSSKPAGSEATINAEKQLVSYSTSGEYVITYSYAINSVTFVKKQFSLKVNTTYNNNSEFTYAFEGTKPATAITGVETKLPKLIGTNKDTGETVDLSYSIKVSKVGSATETTVTDNKYTFASDGDYIVTYSDIKNFFGKTTEDYSFKVEDVADTQKPVVIFGYKDGDKIISEDHILPTKYELENIILPRIYAEDNVPAGITYSRKIRNSDYSINTVLDTTNPSKYIVLNYNAENFDSNPTAAALGLTVANKDTKWISYQLKNSSGNDISFTAGSFTVTYSATDAASNSISKSLPMTLAETITDKASIPTVKFETVIPSEVVINETITFDTPKATDKNDTNMIVTVFVKQAGDSDYSQIEADDNGKFEVNAEEAGSLSIKAIVKNDFGVEGTTTKTINVVSVSDVSAPVRAAVGSTSEIESATIEQSDVVQLPSITFTDTNADKYLNINVAVTDDKGHSINVRNKVLDKSISNQLTIASAEFIAVRSGQYRVTYVATDLAGNITFYSFLTNSVLKTNAPTIVEDIFSSETITCELGESVALPVPKVIDGDGETIDNPDYSIEVVSAGADYNFKLKYEFTPCAEGKYVIKYIVEDGITIVDSPEYTIECVNSKAPVITTEFDEISVRDISSVKVSIPLLSVNTNGANDFDEEASSVEIKKNGITMKTYESLKTDNYEYAFTENGSYSIIYTAVDTAGNTSTKTYTIKVGDTENPTITLDSSLTFSDITVGGKLTLDPAKIVIGDDKDTSINKFDDLKVTVKNTDTNETISNNFTNTSEIEGYEFDMDEVGTYEVKFVLTDAAGNKTTITKTLNVVAKSAETEFPTQTLGIVLIVVSVVILAGVVIYFVLTRKKVLNIDKKKPTKKSK